MNTLVQQPLLMHLTLCKALCSLSTTGETNKNKIQPLLLRTLKPNWEAKHITSFKDKVTDHQYMALLPLKKRYTVYMYTINAKFLFF